MMNTTIKGEVAAVGTVSKKMTTKDANGEVQKTKIIFNQVKLSTASLDYEEVQKFSPNIAQTLLNIQPIPFGSITFNEEHLPLTKNLHLNLKLLLKEEDRSYEGVELVDVEIKKIVVTVKENIPIYTFILWIPIDSNPNRKYLPEFLKNIVNFEFFQTA